MSPDQLKTTINAFNAITEEAEKIPDFKDRMDFYKKCYSTFIGTYVFSYIGRLADHGYMNEIEDVSWTSAIRRIPLQHGSSPDVPYRGLKRVARLNRAASHFSFYKIPGPCAGIFFTSVRGNLPDIP